MVDGFECRFIDDVVAVKERAVLGFRIEVSLEDSSEMLFVWTSSLSKIADPLVH